ncbi:ABC transporter permease [Paenibacillus sp. GXUN7292]|uniref:ABC transporter permease n=1 Tax=Paenibacillus sp. GXUN7292 TaxID=3422499 RepID=UPI003D7D17B1
MAKRWRIFKKNKALLLLTIPGVLYLLVMAYLPMGGIVIAFKDYNYVDGIFGSKWIGLKNFEFLFLSQDAWRITRNTLMMNGLFIVFTTIFAILVALTMNEIRSRFLNRFIQSTLFLPYLLSWVIVSYLVYAMLTTKGFLNSVLLSLDLAPVNWYMEPRFWPYILTIAMVWKVTGYNSIIYLASIIGINPEYFEAAKLDGANKFQQIRYITMPFLIPVITILTLLSIGKIFYADFGLFYSVTRDLGHLYPATDVIDTYVFRMLRTVGDVGMASAAGFYQAVVGFVLVLVFNFIVRKIDKDNALF